jgi:hypothetical protein
MTGRHIAKAQIALLGLLGPDAHAAQFDLTATSGVKTRVHVYKSWKTDCSANVGIVKLVSKPSHGKLETSAIDSTIGLSRHDPDRTRHCVGKSVPGFRIDYTSEPGFRGTDNFTIQATWGSRRIEVDTYTINVR